MSYNERTEPEPDGLQPAERGNRACRNPRPESRWKVYHREFPICGKSYRDVQTTANKAADELMFIHDEKGGGE